MTLDRILEQTSSASPSRRRSPQRARWSRRPSQVGPGRRRGDAPGARRPSDRRRIVIGEGERDEAPMLYIGEEVGALKAGRTASAWTSRWIRSRARTSAPRALPTRPRCSPPPSAADFSRADSYMQKIIVGPTARGGSTSTLRSSKPAGPGEGFLARHRDLTIVVLDRPRHDQLVANPDAGAASPDRRRRPVGRHRRGGPRHRRARGFGTAAHPRE